MSNQLLNPIIQNHPHDTLHYCSNCLNYLQESISTLEFSETSNEARQGLFWLLACVNQAIEFEANRAFSDNDPCYLSRSPTAFEKEIFDSACQQINEGKGRTIFSGLEPQNDSQE